MLEVGKLRARVSGCLCSEMGGDCLGREKCISSCPRAKIFAARGRGGSDDQQPVQASNNGSQQPPSSPHTSHSRDKKCPELYKYQESVWRSGDPTPLTAPRWHLFLLAANLRQNFFPTFFVVKTQPAGGAWVLLTHVSIFREGVCFSPSPQPIFYVSYLTSLNESFNL